MRIKGKILVKTFYFIFIFWRDHTNPIRKKGKILILFFENSLYICKYFVLNIRADSSCPLPRPSCFTLLRLCTRTYMLQNYVSWAN